MKIRLSVLPAILLLQLVAPMVFAAGDTFPTLKAGSEVYSNVTVTTVTATDIYFSHAKGMGNVKLRSLEPELQKRFKYDSTKAGEVEVQQAASTARYQMAVAAKAKVDKLLPNPNEEVPPVETNEQGEPIAPKIYAKSFRGQHAPQILLEKWITLAPALEGKFVLLEFWAASSEPCQRAIPLLNELQEKFKDRLVVIGLTDEPEEEIRKLQEPRVNYAIATDTLGRTKQTIELRAIPHALLIDPKGIVRFEGLPLYLTETSMELLLDRYGN